MAMTWFARPPHARNHRTGEITSLISSVPIAEFTRMQTMPASLMPQGLLEGTTPKQVPDLMTYLITPPEEP